MDPDLQIREGWEGVQCQKKFFWPIRPQFELKILGGEGVGPLGPSPGTAPALRLILFEFLYTTLLGPFCIPPLNQNGTLF